MIHGDVHEFVDYVYHGGELWFTYDGKKYFLEGWYENGRLDLWLYELCDDGVTYHWPGTNTRYPAEDFLNARIWNGKSFWEVEQDMEWLDE